MAKRFVDPAVFDKPKTQWTTSNYRLLEKYQFKCYYCGCELKVSTMQREHVVPRIRGGVGGVTSGNIVPSCFGCNMKKGTKDLEAFRIRLFGKKQRGVFHFEKL